MTFMYRYTVEILPFPLRAKGFTIFNLALSLSLIFNQCVLHYMGIALTNTASQVYQPYCVGAVRHFLSISGRL